MEACDKCEQFSLEANKDYGCVYSYAYDETVFTELENILEIYVAFN